jgi:UDP-N-acetylenolpyruvoylglucosamine reductase
MRVSVSQLRRIIREAALNEADFHTLAVGNDVMFTHSVGMTVTNLGAENEDGSDLVTVKVEGGDGRSHELSLPRWCFQPMSV